MAAELTPEIIDELYDMANKLRIHSVRSTSLAKSGHPSSCSSMAEIISVLFFHTMRFSVKQCRHPANDRFVLSKGHAAPILYAAWAETGAFPVEELDNLRKLPHDLEGHPTPRLDFVDVATGSLGQGLSIAAGMAYTGKNYDQADYRVYCLIGDGESAEGNIWEALSFSGHYKLDNLCVILDCNRLGQSEPTAFQHDTDTYQKRFEAFGLHVLVIDGHNVEELVEAFNTAASTTDQPTAIIAKTFKGRNFPDIEDEEGWHGKALGDKTEACIEHLESLIKNKEATKLKVHPVTCNVKCPAENIISLNDDLEYKSGEEIATRVAYGNALAKLVQHNPRVISLDGDMKNSTYSEKVLKVEPANFIQCFIAEQNLIGVAIGTNCRNRCTPFCSTFAAFLCRAYDQIRMGAISQTSINICGSHCGVSIGEDGPSQMALEDLAMFRAVPNCTIFYPSDAVSCEKAVELAANTFGICYIRTSRPAIPVIYDNGESFEIGKAKILCTSDKDVCLVIGGCVTLHEAIQAKEELANDGVSIRVMDLFTVKPIDKEGIINHALECNGKIVTVEDHYFEGGIGEAVMSACVANSKIIIKQLAVSKIPRSGPPSDLLDYYGISSKHIANAVKELTAVAEEPVTIPVDNI